MRLPEPLDPTYFERLAHDPRPSSWMGEVSLRTEPAALVTVVSGRVVASDPICDMPATALAESFPPGRFSVRLTFVDHPKHGRYVAAAWLLFSNEPPTSWAVAKRQNGLDEAAVDSRFACFADAEASDRVDEQVRGELAAVARACEHGAGWFEMAFPEGAQTTRACNIVGFEAGAGDGCYVTYVGRDSRDSVACLVTDFALLAPHPKPAWW